MKFIILYRLIPCNASFSNFTNFIVCAVSFRRALCRDSWPAALPPWALLCGHEEKPTPNVLKYLLFAAIHPMLCICRIYSSFEGNLLNSNGEGNLLTWAQLDFLLATDQNATALKRFFVYFIYS